ncbi:MAG TPA: DASS family sodium-coupled anion symporter, partial [Nitrospirota bacterium]|nr:DASS family sodium-coupled anion symporter [Nitrospirota bacterium]
FEGWGKKYGFLLAIIVSLAIWFYPMAGTSITQHKLLAIFGGAIVAWITIGVNFAVSCLMTACLLYFWVGNVTGQLKNGVIIRNAEFALSGYASPTLWLLLSGFIICIAMTKTGIAKRLSLHVIGKIGNKPFGAIMAASLTNYLIAPVTPSNAARAAAFVPIVEGIAQAYGIKRGESNFGRALAISAAFASNVTASAFLTGTIANAIAVSVIVGSSGPSTYSSWSYWALAAAPTNLVLLIVSVWLLLKIFPPEIKEIPGGITSIDNELKAMGPISLAEKKAVIFFIIAVALWATDQLHGFNPTMVALFISVLIYMPYIGVMDWRQAQNSLPWELFVYVGGVVTLGNALSQSKAIEVVIKNLFATAGLTGAPKMVMVIILMGFTVFSHFWWSTTTSMAAVMMPIYVGIAMSMGFDVAKFCLPLAMMLSYALFLPFNTVGNVLYFATGYFSVMDLLKAAIIFSLIAYAGWIVTALTWWRIIGLN